MSDKLSNTLIINEGLNLCQDRDTEGFDLQAGETWIYPTNYPVRDYQYNIVQEALYKNTLVSLPTGLGKTFIAAVVMYNFHRWYPNGKIIFMAPTRPLVKQQIDACYNITAIPQEVTAELTGTKLQASRNEIWTNKRVFFVTPQVLQNDLDGVPDLGSKIKCLVFDEAHRAKGNHAYCEVIRKLSSKSKLFRVLALSATPGNKLTDVLEVIQNLLISHLEFRTEESLDVKPYVFERSLETVVVPLGEKLTQVKDDYIKILEKYTRTLMNYKVLAGNCSNLSKGKVFMVMKEFQSKNQSNRTPHYSEIMKSLQICVTLFHAYEVLIRHGLRGFLKFFTDHIDKPLMRGITELHQIMEDVTQYLGPAPNVEPLPDGSYVELSSDTKFGHPKFYYLRDILTSHFSDSNPSSRVIVFFEYRESVMEAHALLLQSRPLIKPRVFLGQGHGVTQKIQINVVKSFREGACNTLLSTCIGEEGLDVGDVDLIVCFDISNKSPIRMIQRMGRTGRKKEGRIIVLVTEGKEQQTLKDCLFRKSGLGTYVMNSNLLMTGMYSDSPRMVPSCINPQCQKICITVKKPVLTKNSNLKDMFRRISFDNQNYLDDVEVVEIKERIEIGTQQFWNSENPLEVEWKTPIIDFSKKLERLRVFQPTGLVGHSKDCEVLVHLLQFADSKRFNIPTTQCTFKNEVIDDKNLKQGDIRKMFSKLPEATSTQSLSQFQTDILNKEKQVTKAFPPELFEEILNYLTISVTSEESCKICSNLFECPKDFQCRKPRTIDLSTWVQPDQSIFDTISAKDLNMFADSLRPECKKLYEDFERDKSIFEDSNLINQLEEEAEKFVNVERIEEKSFAYEAPKSLTKVLNSFKIVNTPEEPETKKVDNNNVLSFFKLTSLEDLFLCDKISESFDSDVTLVYSPKIVTKNSSPDIFEESPDLFLNSSENSLNISEDQESPILSTCDKVQMLKLKAKKRLFNKSTTNEICSQVSKKPTLGNLKLSQKSFYEPKVASPQKVNLSIVNSGAKTKSFDVIDISDICDLSQFGLSKSNTAGAKTEIKTPDSSLKESRNSNKYVDINEICDLSFFGIDDKREREVQSKETLQPTPFSSDNCITKRKQKCSATNIDKSLNVSDICDISDFFSSENDKVSRKFDRSGQSSSQVSLQDSSDSTKASDLVKWKDSSRSIDAFSAISDFCDISSFLSDDMQEPRKNKDDNVIELTETGSSLNDSISTQGISSTPSQLSVTHMLNYINEGDSQKENSPRSTPKPGNKVKNHHAFPVTVEITPPRKVLQLKQNFDSPKSSQKKKRESSTSPSRKRSVFNISLPLDSDDEFEDVTKSPVFLRPKPVKKKTSVLPANKERTKKRKRLVSDYIEDEAVLSDGDKVTVSEDEDSGEDCFEASFVADETLDIPNTQMHLEYIKSVRSPVRKGFKIPNKFRHSVMDVFSQEDNEEEDTYVNDSFCVNTEDADVTECHDLSELELMEKKLKEMKRRRRKPPEKTSKRRRIVQLSDDSE